MPESSWVHLDASISVFPRATDTGTFRSVASASIRVRLPLPMRSAPQAVGNADFRVFRNRQLMVATKQCDTTSNWLDS
jgi:hypothetical protein